MQERDECCRWNWTVRHRGLQPSRHTQTPNAQIEPQTHKITIFSFKTPILCPASDFKNAALARLKLNETNSEQIEILSREIIAFEIIPFGLNIGLPFTRKLDILPRSRTVVMALQNRASPTLMSQKLLERIKLVFP